MGWDSASNWHKPSDVSTELLAEPMAKGCTLLDKAITSGGKHVWLAIQGPDGQTFVAMYLIDKCGQYYGYKAMDEEMGPYFYDCPMRLLDLTEAHKPTSAESTKWRMMVRQYHADKTTSG